MYLDQQRLERMLTGALADRLRPLEIGELLSAQLRGLVPHDTLAVTGYDPGSGLCAYGIWHQLNRSLRAKQLQLTHLGDAATVGPTRPLALIGGRYGGDHPAELELLGRYQVGSELRLALGDGNRVGGMFSLSRGEDSAPFDQEEAARVRQLVRPLTRLLHRYAVSLVPRPGEDRTAPGVVVLDSTYRMRGVTPQAGYWLERTMSTLGVGPVPPEVAVQALGFESALVAQKQARAGRPGPVRLCLPARYAGSWLSVQTEVLDPGSPDSELAVTVGGGRVPLPTLASWYRLTDREHRVVAELRDGAAPKQVARRLGLSVHTVNDHLKAVFRKTDTHSRSELTAIVGS